MQANKPFGSIMIELIARLVGGQLLAVQTVVALAADHRHFSLQQLHPHYTVYKSLTACDEAREIIVQSAEPQSIVDQIGVFLRDQGLEALLLLAETQRFQLAVRIVQDECPGGLVQLARLDADQAVLDVVDAAYAMLAADVVEFLDERHAVHLDAIERDGP